MSAEHTAGDAARIRERIAELDAERAALSRELVQLTRREPAPAPNAEAPPVTVASPAAHKVALFRSLFAGRADVFPLRWENSRTGRSGYAPACANEWKPGVCEKPRIKCGECPHQAFIPLSDGVIASHLRGRARGRARDGEFVAGVYPLLRDETCSLLGADELPQLDGLRLDLRVLAFAVCVALAAAALCSVAPALRATCVDPQDALRGARGAGAGREQHRALRGLVVAEIALSLVMLLGAGLVLRGFTGLLSTDPDFDASQSEARILRRDPSAALSRKVATKYRRRAFAVQAGRLAERHDDGGWEGTGGIHDDGGRRLAFAIDASNVAA